MRERARASANRRRKGRRPDGAADPSSSPSAKPPISPPRRGGAGKALRGDRPSQPLAPGPGTWVVLYLRDPREQAFGRLLAAETAGVWVRGIELESFEAWARECAAKAPSSLGPSTFFVPYLRVEKIVKDEPMGPVPSLRERFEAITGRPIDEGIGD